MVLASLVNMYDLYRYRLLVCLFFSFYALHGLYYLVLTSLFSLESLS